MGKNNVRSKQMNFIRMGGMIVFALSVVSSVGVSKVNAKTVKEDTTLVYTSTESVLDKSYEELIASLDKDTFEEYLSTLDMGNSYVIPGIDKTNIRNEEVCSGMIPQGLCVTEEYLIISAYDKSYKVTNASAQITTTQQKSVLYVMDVESKQYLTTITLDTECHVGALAYNEDDQLIYVADSANGVVQRLSLDKIVECVETGNDTKEDIMKFDQGAIDTQGFVPSFLAYYDEHLYVGQFARYRWDEKDDNEMAVFQRDGTLLKQDTITIPYYAQGVAFSTWKNKTYMLISASYGRNNPAKLHVYLMDNAKDGSLFTKTKIGKITCPNMSEDIDIQGDSIYTCYESASNFYRLALDDNGESDNAIDRIMVSSFKKTIARLVAGDAERYMERMVELPVRYIQHKKVSMDVDYRRRLFLRLS